MLESKIKIIQEQLYELGPMRPGSITLQYRDRKRKVAPFYQLNYMHQMRSRSELVRSEHLARVRKELKAYKKYKKLTTQWVNFSIELSKLKLEELKEGKSTD